MITTYVRQGQHTLRRWALDPQVHQWLRSGAHFLAGFCLSAGSLKQGMLPLVLGLVWACRGWQAVLVAGGGILGYGVFWGGGSAQGILWTVLALAGVLLLGSRRISRELPLLVPALGMLMVSGCGLGFQIFAGDTTPVPLYLIRVALGGAAPWVFTGWLHRQDPVCRWLSWGLLTLGLAQIAPVPWLGLGYVAVGLAGAGGAFPCAAVVGLALDLAGITPVPMTAVAALGYLLRLLPNCPRWAARLGPGTMGLLVMYLCKSFDPVVLPGLFLGGVAAGFLPAFRIVQPRRGETGLLQVRLEMAAGVLAQTGRLLELQPERMVDTDELIQRAAAEACAGCSARVRCRDARRMEKLPGELLHKPLLTMEEIPVRCKKGGRVLSALRRAQEQLRTLQGTQQLQGEYRAATAQQYRFLSTFLTGLSDTLARRENGGEQAFSPVVFGYGNRSRTDNADRYVTFPGVQNLYYIILCDGMGTGPGAVQEGKTAAELLQRMLRCGFPAEHALESLNSLCALRDRAGAVTVDLACIDLGTGKITIYKWGGAPSWVVGGGSIQKLGEATPPPGLAVEAPRTVSCTVTLAKGQTLLLVSDGLEEDRILEACREVRSPAGLGARLIKNASREDDATVVTVQLVPVKA